MSDGVGLVRTVLGDVDVSVVGVTMMHEHIIFDLRCRLEPAPEPYASELIDVPVTAFNRADNVFFPFSGLDNLVLLDEGVAAEELGEYAKWGGSTIVDCTTIGLGRDPLAVRRVAEATGLHVTLGAGYYAYMSHPPEMDGLSVEDIHERIARDICEGIGDTGVRAGHIGEIGCEAFTPNELKVLRGAARAQRDTGSLLNIHQIPTAEFPRNVHRILDMVEAEGGDLGKVVLSHMDRTGPFFETQREILSRGATIEYDGFGYEECHSAWGFLAGVGSEGPIPIGMKSPTQDLGRIQDLARLVEAGGLGQIVVGQDTCLKTMLRRWGGPGYARIVKHAIHGFRQVGFSEDELQAILVGNPRKLLTLK